MDCSLCKKDFSVKEGRCPKVMACGHTYCLACLQHRPRKCPKDGKVYRGLPEKLGDNLSLLELLGLQQQENNAPLVLPPTPTTSTPTPVQPVTTVTLPAPAPTPRPPPVAVPLSASSRQPSARSRPPAASWSKGPNWAAAPWAVAPRPRPANPAAAAAVASAAPLVLFCRTCNAKATEQCVDHHHDVSSYKKARLQRAQGPLDKLTAAKLALEGLRRGMDAAATEQGFELDGCRVRLDDALAERDRKEHKLRHALQADDAAAFEVAVKQAAALSGLPARAVDVLPALGDLHARCSVSLPGPEGAWTASVRLRECAPARLLLLRLACTQELRPPWERAARANREATAEAAAAAASAAAMAVALPEFEERSNASDAAEPTISGAAMAARMQPGSRVARGADWPEGSDVDGHDSRPPWASRLVPATGTVLHKRDFEVDVEWDFDGSVSTHTMGPTVAVSGPAACKALCKAAYQLQLLPRVGPMVTESERGAAWYLDAKKISATSASDDAERKAALLDELQSGYRRQQVRTLDGLRCDVAPEWSLQVLQRVSPRLERLVLIAPDEEHARSAQRMPRLKALYLLAADTASLNAALSAGQIQSLEVHCGFDSPLELAELQLPDRPSLRGLKIGVYPLRAALAVIRAHAATLEKLSLVAASDQPYGCPDLAAELRECTFKKLKELYLCREGFTEYCRHDKRSCGDQVQQMRGMFEESALKVNVKCTYCGVPPPSHV